MAMKRCGRCGKSLPKGDKTAEYLHNVTCKNSVFRAGLYLGKKK